MGLTFTFKVCISNTAILLSIEMVEPRVHSIAVIFINNLIVSNQTNTDFSRNKVYTKLI